MTQIRARDKKKVDMGFGIYVTAIPVSLNSSFRFDCLRCGSCCSNPPAVNPKDVETMAEYKEMSKEYFFDRYVVLQPHISYCWVPMLDTIGDECVFYDNSSGKALCGMQEAKPHICSERPILHLKDYEGNLEDFEMFFQPCRGFGRGEEQTVKKWIEDKKIEEAWLNDAAFYSQINELLGTKMPSWDIKKRIREMFV